MGKVDFKSRDLSALGEKILRAQMLEDATEALHKYGETLDIRRDSLQRLFGGADEVRVSRVRLIYQGNELLPADINVFQRAANATGSAVPGVEVVCQ